MSEETGPEYGITGRDGYIISEALDFAINYIDTLPENERPLADQEDMKLILLQMSPHVALLAGTPGIRPKPVGGDDG